MAMFYNEEPPLNGTVIKANRMLFHGDYVQGTEVAVAPTTSVP
jgi:hypothetical protein